MAAPNLDHLPIDELVSLRGRVAVITGGAKGIGLGVARRLAEAGADVLVADADDQLGPQAALQLTDHGGRALYHRVDVRKPAEVEAAADTAVTELGGLDIWANIAGCARPVRIAANSSRVCSTALAILLSASAR